MVFLLFLLGIVLGDCLLIIPVVGESVRAIGGIGVIIAGRIGVAAQAVGVAQAALDEAVKYTKERVQLCKTLSTFQKTQFTVADMETKVSAAARAGTATSAQSASSIPQSRKPGFIGIHIPSCRLAREFAGEPGVRKKDNCPCPVVFLHESRTFAMISDSLTDPSTA